MLIRPGVAAQLDVELASDILAWFKPSRHSVTQQARFASSVLTPQELVKTCQDRIGRFPSGRARFDVGDARPLGCSGDRDYLAAGAISSAMSTVRFHAPSMIFCCCSAMVV